MDANDKAAKLYATANISPIGWRVTAEETGRWCQVEASGPFTHAVRSAHGVVFHGRFTAATAERFRQSMHQGERSSVIEVAPYYYAEGLGRVEPAAVRPLCPANAANWSVRPHA